MIIHAYNDTQIAIIAILAVLSLGLSAISTRVTWRLYKQSKALENMAQDPGHCHGKPTYPEPDLQLDMWVARSISGEIRLFSHRPQCILGVWDLSPKMHYQGIFGSIPLPRESFPKILVGDQPSEVIVTIEIAPLFKLHGIRFKATGTT